MSKDDFGSFEVGMGGTEEIEVEGAAEGYLELFRRYNVDYVFGSPGSEYIPFWEFLAKSSIEGKGPNYVNARHEGIALAMAKGYTMATGRPQVVLLHVSFGLLHGAMEIKALYNDNIPMLIISGQNITHEEEVWGGSGGPHYLAFTEVGGTQKLVQHYVKWSTAPNTNLNISYILARVFRVALSEPKGPVLILLSRELLFEKIKKMKMPIKINPPTSIQADPRALRKLAKLLIEADNPIIYTRYLGRNPNTVPSLVALADLLSIPVFETPAYMNFPTDHPLHLGYDLTPYLMDADLLLVIDSSGWPPWYPPRSILTSSKAKTVFMDVDPAQLKYPYWGYPADLLITSDSALAVPALIETLKPLVAQTQSSRKKIEERLDRWRIEGERKRADWRQEALIAKDGKQIDARWLCYVLNELIDEDTIIVNETITHNRIINKYVEKNRVKLGNRFDGAGASASTGLGQGLGVALGLKLAKPDRTVIALEGDGCFNYNPVLAGFGLAQKYHLPFLTIIFDNQSYAAMKHHPKYYSEGWSVRENIYHGVYQEPKPEYTKLAEAFGGYAEMIEDPEAVKQALTRCLNHVKKGRLALLDVILPKP